MLCLRDDFLPPAFLVFLPRDFSLDFKLRLGRFLGVVLRAIECPLSSLGRNVSKMT